MNRLGVAPPIFYPPVNPFIASNPRFSPELPNDEVNQAPNNRFYHVPLNVNHENQQYSDPIHLNNEFDYYADGPHVRPIDGREWIPQQELDIPINNVPERPPYVMYPRLFGQSKDISIQINSDNVKPSFIPRDNDKIDLNLQKVKPPELDRKGLDIDVSPPFGKAYIPPTHDTKASIFLEGTFSTPEATSFVYNNTTDSLNSFVTASSINQTSLHGGNYTYSCGNDLDNLGNNVYLYGLGFLIVIAVLFNGLQFAVFRTKSLRKFAFSMYLSAVAVTDSLALFSHIPRRWMNILYQTLDWGLGVTVYDTNSIACRGLTYFSYVARFLSAWIVVALAIERYTVSKDPYKKSKIRKPKIALHALLGMLVVSLAINCHVIFTWDVIPKETVFICSPSQESEMLSLFLTIISLFSIVVLPFTITIIITVIMLQNLQSKSWKLRPRKISVHTVSKLQFERKTILMVSMITGVHSLLSIPFIIAWIVLLGQHFSPPTDPCQYVKTYAAKDITEVVYMATCALKFVFCVFCGTNIVSYK